MERSAIIIVCNGEPFIELQLKHIYNIVDEIIIVEGPDYHYEKLIKSKRSIDNTINIIKNFPDPSNKIKLIHTNCDKNTMVAKGNKLCNGKYIYQIDIDEFISHKMINMAFDALKNNNGQPTTIMVPERWYYKWYDTHLSSGRPNHIRALPGRFCVNMKNNDMLISHIPSNGYQKNNQHISSKTINPYKNEYGHHFLAIYRWQLLLKIMHYTLRRNFPLKVIQNKINDYDNFNRSDIGSKTIKSYSGYLLIDKPNDIDILNDEIIDKLNNFKQQKTINSILNNIERNL